MADSTEDGLQFKRLSRAEVNKAFMDREAREPYRAIFDGIKVGEGAQVKKPADKSLFATKLAISQVAKEMGWRVRYPRPSLDDEGWVTFRVTPWKEAAAS